MECERSRSQAWTPYTGSSVLFLPNQTVLSDLLVFFYLSLILCVVLFPKALNCPVYAVAETVEQWLCNVTYIISVQIIAHLTVRKFNATLTLNRKSVMVNIGGNVVKSQ